MSKAVASIFIFFFCLNLSRGIPVQRVDDVQVQKICSSSGNPSGATHRDEAPAFENISEELNSLQKKNCTQPEDGPGAIILTGISHALGCSMAKLSGIHRNTASRLLYLEICNLRL